MNSIEYKANEIVLQFDCSKLSNRVIDMHEKNYVSIWGRVYVHLIPRIPSPPLRGTINMLKGRLSLARDSSSRNECRGWLGANLEAREQNNLETLSFFTSIEARTAFRRIFCIRLIIMWIQLN